MQLHNVSLVQHDYHQHACMHGLSRKSSAMCLPPLQPIAVPNSHLAAAPQE
jgi:hypothetical protein